MKNSENVGHIVLAIVRNYLTTQILSATLLNSNLGHSLLIYLRLINVASKFVN